MHWLSRLNRYRLGNPLAMRLLALILLCSSLITLLATALQLYLDYRYDLSRIDSRIEQIEASALDSLSNSLWVIDPVQVQLQLDGLKQLPDVVYLRLKTRYDERFEAGAPPKPDSRLVIRDYGLSHSTAEGETYPLGNLRLVISLDGVYQRLRERVLVILASQGVKTFLVSAFILYIFWRLITQHLSALAHYAGSLRLDSLDRPMSLRRPRRNDELGKVVTALDDMRCNLRDSIALRSRAETALAELNLELEARVRQRTGELEASNRALQSALERLQCTQAQLIESEKMAAIGGLVAGVAHEISTPLGVGYTAASYLEQQARTRCGTLEPDSSALERNFTATTLESSELIRQNLGRAAELIRAFKQVSVDQSSEKRRRFDLGRYLDEILLSLRPRLREQHPTISVECPAELGLNSYPSALYQIVSNLVLNSLIHGFDGRDDGCIWIEVTAAADSVLIRYRDNGAGVAPKVRHSLFQPFVTTRRHQGCSGLGMHILYNLVTQLLRGSVRLRDDWPDGACFEIEIPR